MTIAKLALPFGLLLSAALLTACPRSHGVPREESVGRDGSAGNTIALRFAWPSPLALRVERSFERLERHPDGSELPPRRSKSRFTWRGESSGLKYKVAFADFEVVEAEPKSTSTDGLVQLEHASRAVDPLLPTIVVEGTGQPGSLEDVPKLRDQVKARYRAVPGLTGEQAERMIGVLTSEHVLNQRALEDWNRMVSVWSGATAELGAVKEKEDDAGSSASGGVRNVFSYSAEKRIPCDSADTQELCVRLVVKQVPRFDDVRAASRALLGFDPVPALGAPPTARLEVVNTFTTDTHPETLVPVRYIKEKRWSVSWDEGGQERVLGRTDRWESQFTPIR